MCSRTWRANRVRPWRQSRPGQTGSWRDHSNVNGVGVARIDSLIDHEISLDWDV